MATEIVVLPTLVDLDIAPFSRSAVLNHLVEERIQNFIPLISKFELFFCGINWFDYCCITGNE